MTVALTMERISTMKKIITILAAVLLLASSVCASDREEGGFGILLADLLEAYENPSEEDSGRIDADVEAIADNREIAQCVADHWRKVYLDPDYRLYLDGKDDPAQLPVEDASAHAFVVLGYELENGEMTDELKGRCNAAAAAAKAFPESILVCSGGATGKNNPEKHTEAGLMKEYLSEVCGIGAERIFTDEKAMTTAENALNTFVILKEQGIRTMTIVTSSYHQRWGQVLYNAVGAQYRQESGYSAEIIGNYCFDTEPSVAIFNRDEAFAIWQLGGILGLGADEMRLLPNIMEEFLAGQKQDTVPAPVTQAGRPEETYDMHTNFGYTLAGAHGVAGRQGVAWMNDGFIVSGSTSLSRYDGGWNEVLTHEMAFTGGVNHIGDIDVYEGEIYAGEERFVDGVASDIRIAVYDAETFELKRYYPFDPESGQTEVSGLAVDPDTGSVWLCSWADGESGRYLYRYGLETGEYLGKYHLQAPPQWIQGVAYYDGWLYLTADDGTADLGEPDHVYRCRVDLESTAWPVFLERTLDDVTLMGEVEGLTFDPENRRLFVSCNRGAQIVLGMPKGFYEGYEEEIHEVFEYRMD